MQAAATVGPVAGQAMRAVALARMKSAEPSQIGPMVSQWASKNGMSDLP